MPPTPTPTPAQVVSVMEITGENDYDYVSALVNAGDDEEATAKWAATLLDIEEWASKVRGKYFELNGKVILKPGTREEKIRARVRERYGLTSRPSADVTGEYPMSCSVPVEAW